MQFVNCHVAARRWRATWPESLASGRKTVMGASNTKLLEKQAASLRAQAWPGLRTNWRVDRSLAMFFNDAKAPLQYNEKRRLHYVSLPRYTRLDDALLVAVALVLKLHATLSPEEFVARFVRANGLESPVPQLHEEYRLAVFIDGVGNASTAQINRRVAQLLGQERLKNDIFVYHQ